MTVEDRANLKKMITFMRSQGVKKLKLGEIDIELQEVAQKPLSAYKRRQISKDNGMEDGGVQLQPYSEEDVLFWSSTQLPSKSDEE